jgi:hypothetical protein
MNHDFLIGSVQLNQAFESTVGSGGGVTRRSFIKRTGGATIATLVALHVTSQQAFATENSNPSPSYYALKCNLDPVDNQQQISAIGENGTFRRAAASPKSSTVWELDEEIKIHFRVNGQATGPKKDDSNGKMFRYAPTIAFMDLRVEYQGAMGNHLLEEPTAGDRPYFSNGENLDLTFNQVNSSEEIDGNTSAVTIRRGQERTMPFYATYNTYPYSGTTGSRGTVKVVLDGEFVVYANADKKEVLMGLKRLTVIVGETKLVGGTITIKNLGGGLSWGEFLTHLPNAPVKNLSFVWDKEIQKVSTFPTTTYV